MYFITVQLPFSVTSSVTMAHATIFDRAQCLKHPNDNYVCYKNRPGQNKKNLSLQVIIFDKVE